MKIAVRVQPCAGRDRVVKRPDGSLKVFLCAVAEDGKANKALREVIAGHYGVKKQEVCIIAGHLARNKIVEIIGGRDGVTKT